LLLIVLILGLVDRVRQDQSGSVGVLSMYWHFVDAVWFVVFTVVYILGR
jgi:cytochrome c oxidase subunit 3